MAILLILTPTPVELQGKLSVDTGLGMRTGRVRADGEWGETLVKQPQIFKTYKMKMNGVDRSDQILSAFSTRWKCVRWWKKKNFEHLKDHATSGVDCFTKRSFQLGKDMVFQAMPDEWNSIPQQELQTSDSEKQLHS